MITEFPLWLNPQLASKWLYNMNLYWSNSINTDISDVLQAQSWITGVCEACNVPVEEYLELCCID
jgi:hypothetical protein